MIRFKKRAAADVTTPAADKVTLFVDDTGVAKLKNEAGTVSSVGGGIAEALIDAAGDLIVGTAADTAGRLAKGTALQVLRVNAGATALEYAAPGATVTVIRKTADESVTSSAVLQADNHLILPVLANEVWLVDWTLFYTGATTGDIGIDVAIPAAATGVWGAQMLSNGVASADGVTIRFQGLTAFDGGGLTFGAAGAAVVCVGKVFASVANGANAGNITLKWAQRASDVTATTVMAGSFLHGTKV